MPTKTNKSPLTLPPALIGTAVKGVLGGVTGGLTAGLGELKQIREEFKEKDFKNQKFGKKLGMLAKAGLRGFGAYQQGMLGGTVKGITGSDMGIGSVGLLANNQPGVQPVEQQPTYSTNIDPMTGEEIPLTMTGNMKPLKMLTGVKGNIPHNMSAAQYKSSLKMQEISGANTLPPALTLKGNQYKIDANNDGEITGEDFKLLKNK